MEAGHWKISFSRRHSSYTSTTQLARRINGISTLELGRQTGLVDWISGDDKWRGPTRYGLIAFAVRDRNGGPDQDSPDEF